MVEGAADRTLVAGEIRDLCEPSLEIELDLGVRIVERRLEEGRQAERRELVELARHLVARGDDGVAAVEALPGLDEGRHRTVEPGDAVDVEAVVACALDAQRQHALRRLGVEPGYPVADARAWIAYP